MSAETQPQPQQSTDAPQGFGATLASALAGLATSTPSKEPVTTAAAADDSLLVSPMQDWESQGVFVKRRKRGFSQDNTPFQSPEMARAVPQLERLPSLQLDDAAAAPPPAPLDFTEANPQAAVETATAEETTDQNQRKSDETRVEAAVQLPKGFLSAAAAAAEDEEFIFSAEGAPPLLPVTRVWSDCVDETSPLFGVSPVFPLSAAAAAKKKDRKEEQGTPSPSPTSSSTWADLAKHHRPEDRRRLVAPQPLADATNSNSNSSGKREATAAVFIGSLKHFMDDKWVMRFFRPYGARSVLGSGSGFAVVEVAAAQADAFVEAFSGRKVDGKKLTVRHSNRPAAAHPSSAANASPGRS